VSHYRPALSSCRLAIAVLAATAVASTASAQSVMAPTPLPPLIPADRAVAQVVISLDTTRAYVVTPSGELWFYDRAHNSGKLAPGPVWGLSLAPSGTALAFVRGGVKATDRTVWLLPLDPRTGRPSGPEHRVSPGAGDVPAVSPDGGLVAFAADDSSGVGQSVSVVPVAGGRPRVVLPSVVNGVGAIHWTPDSKALFVGINPPVPCIPDWSCLPLKPALSQAHGSIVRVPADGGAPTSVATTNTPFPGLSPDGGLLIFGDTGRSRSMVVATPDGRRLQTLPLGNGETVQGWIGSSGLLLSATQARWRVERYSLATHSRTTLMETVDAISDPAISPDGGLVSLVRCAGGGCHLHIIAADGAPRRDIPLTDPWMAGNVWSPDQHLLAIVTRGNGTTLHVSTIDPSSGRITPLGDLASVTRPTMAWLADSRTLVVAQPHTIGNNSWRTQFTAFDLAGHRRDLRDVAAGPSDGGAFPIDTTAALIFRMVQPPAPLAGSAPVASLPTTVVVRIPFATGTENPLPLPAGYYYPPSISFDRNWLALRTFRVPATEPGRFEVIRVDGKSSHTVTVPFTPTFGDDNPAIFAGGTQLILRESPNGNHDAGVYLVDVAANRATSLFTVPATARIARLSLAANGSALIYATVESAAPRLSILDVAQLVGATRH
jgi:Tol biopolymer transport system component